MTEYEQTQPLGAVLIVDDDEATCEAVSLMLEDAGYQTHSVATVDDGRDYLDAHPEIVLVIADMLLKDNDDGVQAINIALKECQSEAALLAASATHGITGELVLFGEAGAGRPYDCIDKPFEVEDFMRKVLGLIVRAHAAARGPQD